MTRISDLANSNYWKHMGMAIIKDPEGNTKVTLEIDENLKQFYGNLHGGAIAGLLDSTIAVALNQELGPEEGAITVEMKLNYLRPVNTGTLVGEGKVIQKGRKIIVGQGEIKDGAGNLIAFGTATFMVTTPGYRG